MSPRRGARSGLLAAAVVVSAVNLRTAVTSVGALLDELETELGMSTGQAGLLTALPLMTFAAVGWQAPRLGRVLGDGWALAASLIVMTVGLVLRASTSDPTVFLAATALALVGGAVGNVAIPTIIKASFPHRIGAMTAAYVTALAIGQSLAAGLSIPAARLGAQTNWRLGIGVWAVVSLLSALPWLAVASSARSRTGTRPASVNPWTLVRSSTARLVTLYFATQSAQVFVVFGWFTSFFRDAGLDAESAAGLVAVYSLLFIPISLLVPFAMARARGQRLVLVTPTVLGAAAYLGMLLGGGSGAWVWIILAAAGNAAFPAVLTLFTLRTQLAETTAALAAFAQSVGYLLASLGPLLVGWLHGLTDGWQAPLVALLGLAALQLLVGVPLGRERYVEADLRGRSAPQPSPPV